MFPGGGLLAFLNGRVGAGLFFLSIAIAVYSVIAVTAAAIWMRSARRPGPCSAGSAGTERTSIMQGHHPSAALVAGVAALPLLLAAWLCAASLIFWQALLVMQPVHYTGLAYSPWMWWEATRYWAQSSLFRQLLVCLGRGAGAADRGRRRALGLDG